MKYREAEGADTIKTLQIYNVRILFCLCKPVKVTDNRKDTSLLRKLFVFTNYVTFYGTGPRGEKPCVGREFQSKITFQFLAAKPQN